MVWKNQSRNAMIKKVSYSLFHFCFFNFSFPLAFFTLLMTLEFLCKHLYIAIFDAEKCLQTQTLYWLSFLLTKLDDLSFLKGRRHESFSSNAISIKFIRFSCDLTSLLIVEVNFFVTFFSIGKNWTKKLQKLLNIVYEKK